MEKPNGDTWTVPGVLADGRPVRSAVMHMPVYGHFDPTFTVVVEEPQGERSDPLALRRYMVFRVRYDQVTGRWAPHEGFTVDGPATWNVALRFFVRRVSDSIV